MNWFEALTGFPEESPGQVRGQIMAEGNTLRSLANGRVLQYGQLETPTLAELQSRVSTRARVRSLAGVGVKEAGHRAGTLSIREIVADVQQLHTEETNAGALFQVASQFNLLEMVSPHVTPEHGVGRYEHDRTQGPACAVAAGAGTIYRNYFVPVNGQAGQSADHQIDCLADLGAALGNEGNRLWEMRNGYALASRSGLVEINRRLQAASAVERDDLRGLLRIGLQRDTQVTLDGCGHAVSQAYCSALPVAYAPHEPQLWEPFARLVLEGAYEATLCAGLLNAERMGNRRVFLTQLGGGAFGNRAAWILDAAARALELFRAVDLDVAIVSYGASNPDVQELVRRWESARAHG